MYVYVYGALHTYCRVHGGGGIAFAYYYHIISSGTSPRTMESQRPGLHISVEELYRAKLCLAWENAFTHA